MAGAHNGHVFGSLCFDAGTIGAVEPYCRLIHGIGFWKSGFLSLDDELLHARWTCNQSMLHIFLRFRVTQGPTFRLQVRIWAVLSYKKDSSQREKSWAVRVRPQSHWCKWIRLETDCFISHFSLVYLASSFRYHSLSHDGVMMDRDIDWSCTVRIRTPLSVVTILNTFEFFNFQRTSLRVLF